MTSFHPERSESLPPTIDVIVLQALCAVADTHIRDTEDYDVPASAEEWTALLETDTNKENRLNAITNLLATIENRMNLQIGDPRDIERVIGKTGERPVLELISYFVEASIFQVKGLIERLKKSNESLEWEKTQKDNEDWLREAQARVDNNLKLLQQAMEEYAKVQWIYKHVNDPSIQEEVITTLKKCNNSQRSFLK